MKKQWTKPGVVEFGNVEQITLQFNKNLNASDGLSIAGIPIGFNS